jgi:hypothetical protein
VTVTLHLDPDVEKRLIAQAHERGVSLDDYVQEIVTREACSSVSAPSSIRAANLSDLLLNSPFARANPQLERSQDYSRPTELE